MNGGQHRKVLTTAVSLDESHRLNQAMTATPQVRSAEVARARALLADPQFPSPQSLEKVASLFAKHLSVETAAK